MRHIGYIVGASIVIMMCGCVKSEELSFNSDNLCFSVQVASTHTKDDSAQTKAGTAECFLSDEAGTMSIPLTCEVRSMEVPATKGSLINNKDNSGANVDLSGYCTEFQAFAYKSRVGFFTKASDNKETVSYSSGKWAAAHSYKWPEDTDLQVFACANLPTGEGVASVSCEIDSEISDAMKEVLVYNVPEKASEQNDILLGLYCGTGIRNDADMTATAAIVFKHPLTCIRIKAGDLSDLGIINKISLIGAGASCSAYLNKNGELSYICSDYSQTVYQQSETGLPVDDDGYIGGPFIIIPQTLSDYPLTLNVESASGLTLYAELGSVTTDMQSGKVYEITIGYDNDIYVFNLVGDSDELNYKNTTATESQSISIVSYRYAADDPTATTPVDFSVQYSNDGGVTWKSSVNGLSGLNNNNAGSVTPRQYTITASNKTVTIPDPSSHYVWENDPYGAMQDLSLLDANGDAVTGGANSANCYIIHHPGEYKFPLVYGNALKNGTIISSGYHTSNTGSNILSTFVNCFGDAITNGNILTDLSGKVSNPQACLLWQDAWEGKSTSNPGEGFITSVGISGNFITFSTASGANLVESNAMIALYDEKGSNNQYDEGIDQILWSWHIWATPEDFSASGCKETENGYMFAPAPLGLCRGRKIIYQISDIRDREILIRLTQIKGHAAPIVIKVNRPDIQSVKNANYPTFQMWRKDPIRADTYEPGGIKTWYTLDGNQIPNHNALVLPTGTSDIDAFASEISHPHLYVSDGPVGASAKKVRHYYNLWSMSSTSIDYSTATDNQKTIYDPSPYGFKVPCASAFVKLTSDIMIADDKPDMRAYSYGEVTFPFLGVWWYWENYRRYPMDYFSANVYRAEDFSNKSFNPQMGYSESQSSTIYSCPILPVRDN